MDAQTLIRPRAGWRDVTNSPQKVSNLEIGQRRIYAAAVVNSFNGGPQIISRCLMSFQLASKGVTGFKFQGIDTIKSEWDDPHLGVIHEITTKTGDLKDSIMTYPQNRAVKSTIEIPVAFVDTISETLKKHIQGNRIDHISSEASRAISKRRISNFTSLEAIFSAVDNQNKDIATRVRGLPVYGSSLAIGVHEKCER